MNPRAKAAQIINHVVTDGRSLRELFSTIKEDDPNKQLIKALCFETLRWHEVLTTLVTPYLDKPIKEPLLQQLLLMGVCQLFCMNKPAHAAVDETVTAAKVLRMNWAAGLLNAVMRNLIRAHEKLPFDTIHGIEHQRTWLVNALISAWPEQWTTILEQQLQHPPMTLRVNLQQISREDYLLPLADKGIKADACTHSSSGIRLENPIDVKKLPGFEKGFVSVQDEAAQLAAQILNPQKGDRVLDACAAPGGKTGHLLECQKDLSVTAVDITNERTQFIHENLNRLGLSANVQTADLTDKNAWWDLVPFDRILLDVPCSSTGVIRRHPDIKFTRRISDIPELAKQQRQLLETVWPCLKPGGHLLYATCSILPDENWRVIHQFLIDYPDAKAVPIQANWGHTLPAGRQILPGENDMDGFYYALLTKTS